MIPSKLVATGMSTLLRDALANSPKNEPVTMIACAPVDAA